MVTVRESPAPGFTGLWSVADDYVITGDGLVCPLHQGKVIDPMAHEADKTWYAPLGRAELPQEFARLASGDHEALLGFVRRYGLLGWRSALRPANQTEPAEVAIALAGGDPLPWIVSHAKAVQLALTLTEALSDERRLAGITEALKVRSGDTVSIEYESIKQGSLYKGKTQQRVTTPRQDALFIISHLVNPNLTSCVRQLQPTPRKHPKEMQQQFTFHNLMDCIYWLLADAIVNARVRLCLNCGKPIIAASDRVKYCPPPMGSVSVSPCMNQAKQRRYREEHSKTRKHKPKQRKRKKGAKQ